MAFEDAYELAECLSVAPNIEVELIAYANSRIPRTEVIYARSAARGMALINQIVKPHSLK